MPEKGLSGKHFAALVMMFLLGSPVVTGMARASGQNSWLATLAAIPAALLLLLVFARLCALYPGLSLFDMLERALGKFAGRLVALYYAVALTLLAAHHTGMFLTFLGIAFLPRTPKIVTGLILLLLCLLLLHGSVEALGRSAFVFAVLTVLFLVLTTVFLGNIMIPEKLLPAWDVRLETLARDAAFQLFYPFADAAFCLIFAGSLRLSTKPRRALLGGFFVGAGLLLAGALRDIMSLGGPAYATSHYPAYIAASLVSIGGFFQRAEALMGAVFLFCIVIKLSALLFGAASGMALLFRMPSPRRLFAPLALMVLILSLALFNESREWRATLLFALLPAQTLLPFLVWLVAEFRVRRRTV